jgi:hypothetical protein
VVQGAGRSKSRRLRYLKKPQAAFVFHCRLFTSTADISSAVFFPSYRFMTELVHSAIGVSRIALRPLLGLPVGFGKMAFCIVLEVHSIPPPFRSRAAALRPCLEPDHDKRRCQTGGIRAVRPPPCARRGGAVRDKTRPR